MREEKRGEREKKGKNRGEWKEEGAKLKVRETNEWNESSRGEEEVGRNYLHMFLRPLRNSSGNVASPARRGVTARRYGHRRNVRVVSSRRVHDDATDRLLMISSGR